MQTDQSIENITPNFIVGLLHPGAQPTWRKIISKIYFCHLTSENIDTI